MNYKTMDIFTKGALWDYWKLGSDEIEPTNEKTSNLEETNHDDEQEIDPDVLTKDIEGFKTYEEYKDDWIYKWNKDVPWMHEKPWTDGGAWKEPTPRRWDGYKNADHDQEEREYENEHEDEERCELFDDHELPVCTVRRFEMIKYSFGQDEEYVAVKEDEYIDLTSINEDACRAYKEIFRVMDEGWMVIRAE
ncbi:hypothetical protein Tco_1348528 [Tanacetum coccineum]